MTMAEARSRAAWDHTSHILALLANCFGRGKGKSAFQPRQFHPFYPRKHPPTLPFEKHETFALMKEVFVGGAGRSDTGGFGVRRADGQ